MIGVDNGGEGRKGGRKEVYKGRGWCSTGGGGTWKGMEVGGVTSLSSRVSMCEAINANRQNIVAVLARMRLYNYNYNYTCTSQRYATLKQGFWTFMGESLPLTDRSL